MDILRLIFSFVAATAVGWNILFFLLKRDISFSALEKLALSYIIGLGALTLQMFFYSMAGIGFSLPSLLLPHAAIVIFTVFVFTRSKPAGDRPKPARNGKSDIILSAGILFQVLHAFFKALIKPMDSFDSIGNFAFKAKLFFIEKRIPYELFLNKSVDLQHPDYPLFVPLSETWVYMFLGKWNDLLVKALFPMFFAALLIIFYFALKRIIGKRLALAASFFLATIPHFLNYATIGYADFALAMFYSASFLYMFLWFSYRREGQYLFLAALFSLLAAWTKNEGVMLSLVNIAMLLLFAVLNFKNLARKDIGRIFIFIALLAVFSFAWLNFTSSMGFENETVNRNTFKLGIALKNLDRSVLVLYDLQKHIFGPKKWNISLLVFAAGLIICFKKAFRGDFKYITLSIAAAFFGYTAVYLITPLEIHYHLQTAGSRLLLHFLPLVVFWICYMAKEISNAEDDISR